MHGYLTMRALSQNAEVRDRRRVRSFRANNAFEIQNRMAFFKFKKFPTLRSMDADKKGIIEVTIPGNNENIRI